MEFFRNVVFSVSDMEVSSKWYQKNLGFKLMRDYYVLKLKCRVAYLENSGLEIQLVEKEGATLLPEKNKTPWTAIDNIGIKHITFTTEDMASLKSKFFANEVKIVNEVNIRGEKAMFVSDPDGMLIEFIEERK